MNGFKPRGSIGSPLACCCRRSASGVTPGVIQLGAQGALAAIAFVNFDLKNGKIGKVSPGSSTVGMLQVTIKPYRNGWYRLSITITAASAASPLFTVALVNDDSSATAVPSYLPSTPKSLWVWGRRLSAGMVIHRIFRLQARSYARE
ncbi:phage head spike fiber domain-containing protein [Klebsiella pasteurii]|uniref:phage head spike fiber domain-containing protein n=1 Tax=Klebsiella pasteurii TaxID=2587529 RepID=UPI0040556DC1